MEKISRRNLLRLAAGGAAAAALPVMGASANPETQDNCYWYKEEGPYCSNGQLVEKWCFTCCAGINCEPPTCEWRVVGSC